MSEYKPSFVFQSKILSSETTVDNNNPIVSTQPDQDNTLGSVTTNLTGLVLSGPNTDSNWEDAEGLSLAGGTPTGRDLLTNPSFQYSLVMLANQLSYGDGLPTCPPGNTLATVDNGTDPLTGKQIFTIECSQVDENQPEVIKKNAQPGAYFADFDDQVEDIVSHSQTYLNSAKNSRFLELLSQPGSGEDFESLLADLKGDGSNPWDKYAVILLGEIDKVMSDPNMPPLQKGEEMVWVLQQLDNVILIQSWDVDPGLTPKFVNARSAMEDLILETAATVANDQVLNNPVEVGSVKQVINNMSRRPPYRRCPPGKVINYYGEYNQFWECVCPINTVPCPDSDTCIKCEAPAIAVFNPPTMFSPGGCECKCPEGLEVHGSECREPCPPGMFYPYGFRRCACRKNVGSWLFPRYLPVYGSDCPSGLQPDPANNCECSCLEGVIQTNPDNSSEQRCTTPCSGGKVYNWGSDDCECPTDFCPPNETVIEDADGCSCSGTSSGSYSYSSLSLAEMEKIANHFGYTINHKVEFL